MNTTRLAVTALALALAGAAPAAASTLPYIEQENVYKLNTKHDTVKNSVGNVR